MRLTKVLSFYFFFEKKYICNCFQILFSGILEFKKILLSKECAELLTWLESEPLCLTA